MTKKRMTGLGPLLVDIHGPETVPRAKEMVVDRMAALHRILEKLPSEQREIVVRRSIRKESYFSIAASLNRSPEAVRVIWRSAFGKIFNQMNDRKTLDHESTN